MPSRPDTHARTVLPIPDRPYAGTVVYDHKNPDATFPAIEPLRGRPSYAAARAAVAERARTVIDALGL